MLKRVILQTSIHVIIEIFLILYRNQKINFFEKILQKF